MFTSQRMRCIYPLAIILLVLSGCQTVSHYPVVTELPPAPVGFPQLSVCIEPFDFEISEEFRNSENVIQTAEQRRQVVVGNPSLVTPEIRTVEAVYLAQELKSILADTYFFSNVTVLPVASRCSDLTVKVKILESDGNQVKLQATMSDSYGRRLGRTSKRQTFSFETSEKDYALEKGDDGMSFYMTDPYHPILLQVADWIIRSLPSPEGCSDIQNMTVVKYANELAPDIFGDDYLEERSDGSYDYISLPNQADPFFQAVLNTLSVEMSLYDNFDQYYLDAHNSFDTPYFQWRESNGEAVEEYKRFKRHVSMSNITGIMAEVLIVAAVGDWEDMNNLERTLIVLSFLMQFQKDEYGNIIFDPTSMIPSLEPLVNNSREMSQLSDEYAQKAAEVSMAFEENAKPVSLELRGRTYVLEGKIDEQFEQLATLVQEYYEEETGF